MPRDEYERTLDLLKELEADELKHGLFSCFGLLPSGEVIYFDEVGTPCRVYARGTALVRGAPLNLKKSLPVEVVPTEEAFKHLADYQRNLYLKEQTFQRAKKANWERSRGRRTLRWLAAAGLVVFLASVLVFTLYPGGPDQKLRDAEQRLKDFYAERGINISGYKDVMVVNTGGYNPLGPVSISRVTFKQFLQEMNSPALPEADAMYQSCIEEGCDPAVVLAFFEHESSGGNQGVAVFTKSIGNIRCTTGYACYDTAGNGSFRKYNTWADGVRDWARLLKMYKDDWKRVTLEDIIPKYAPQADNNNEAAYISAVKKRVDNLRQRETTTSAPSKPPVNDIPVGNPVWENDMVITQGFTAKHPEVDIARPLSVALGTNIHSTIDGVVTVVRNDPLFGNRVFVTGAQFTTHYNHLLDDIPVQSGQVVKRGDIIGLMGSTGKSTGPHLDYEIFQGSQRVNPLDWLFRQ
jgi:murein DD-endopeptidase MepM/ murein hydrolase activator NlpD